MNADLEQTAARPEVPPDPVALASEFGRTDFFYLFGPKSYAHIQFYRAWVEAARCRGIPMQLLGVVPSSSLNALDYDRIQNYSALPYVRLLKTGWIVRGRLRLLAFLLWRLLRGRRVVIQAHKFPTQLFDQLKWLVGRRLQYTIPLEGDPVSEAYYLREHPFKPGFYDQEIQRSLAQARRLPDQLRRCDHLLVVSDALRDLLIARYPEADLAAKTTVVPTGFDQRRHRFSESLRRQVRLELGVQQRFVVTYIGNIYYSWQSFARTAQIYDLLRRQSGRELFLLLLIRQQDHALALDFLDPYEIPAEEMFLAQVSGEELTGYLNAADLGVVLRHEHAVSRLAGVPGKLGDYAACGLPVLLNRGVAGWEDVLRVRGGAVLEDMDDNAEVLSKVKPLLQYDRNRRRRIEEWAHRKLSADAHGDRYAAVLRDLAQTTTGS
ncbi:MAG: hypothetical protein ACRD1R_16320 [Acidobacteriota bacterium]